MGKMEKYISSLLWNGGGGVDSKQIKHELLCFPRRSFSLPKSCSHNITLSLPPLMSSHVFSFISHCLLAHCRLASECHSLLKFLLLGTELRLSIQNSYVEALPLNVTGFGVGAFGRYFCFVEVMRMGTEWWV